MEENKLRMPGLNCILRQANLTPRKRRAFFCRLSRLIRRVSVALVLVPSAEPFKFCCLLLIVAPGPRLSLISVNSRERRTFEESSWAAACFKVLSFDPSAAADWLLVPARCFLSSGRWLRVLRSFLRWLFGIFAFSYVLLLLEFVSW